jgi:hypothetical protein
MKVKDIIDLDKRRDRIILAVYIFWIGFQIFLMFYAGAPWGKDWHTDIYNQEPHWIYHTEYFYPFTECSFGFSYDYTETLVYVIIPVILFLVFRLITYKPKNEI